MLPFLSLGDAMPPSTIDSWFRSMGLGKTLPPALAQPHDIYAIGGQVLIVPLELARSDVSGMEDS